MKIGKYNHIILNIVIYCAAFLFFFSCQLYCSQSKISDDIITVQYPQFLSYQFFNIHTGSLSNQITIPCDFDNDSIYEAISFQQDYDEHQSALYYYTDPKASKAIIQLNVPVNRINDYLLADLNKDYKTDVVFTYNNNDTIWVQVYLPDGHGYRKVPISTGTNNDTNSGWDGVGRLDAAVDLNNDNIRDIIISCCAGFDRTPREIVAVDIKNSTILWRICFPSIASTPTINFKQPIMTDDGLILTSPALGNNVSCNGFSDTLAYIFYLQFDGTIKWHRQLGPPFHYPKQQLLRLPDSKRSYIVVTTGQHQENNSQHSRSGLLLLDFENNIVDSLSFGIDENIYSLDTITYNNQPTIVVTTSGNRLFLISNAFQTVRSYTFEAPVRFHGYKNFLNNKQSQFLLSSDNNKLWLLDHQLKPLAVLEDIQASRVFYYKDSTTDNTYNILVNQTNNAEILKILNTPWYMILFRYPIQSQYVFAILVCISLIYMVMLSKRKRTITKQRNQLATTLLELKTTQQQLVEAEKYKQAKDLAGGFAHEIRNALFPAETSLFQLKREKAFNQKTVYNIDQALKRALQLTRRINQYVKLEQQYNPEKVNFNKLIFQVEDSLETVLKERGVNLTIQVPPRCYMQSNFEQLYIVFTNLIFNSLDALTETDNPQIQITAEETEQSVEIVYSDNGCGLDHDNADRIFEEFFTSKPNKGTGLGVNIIKKIIDLYEGSIILLSTPSSKGLSYKIKMRKG